MKKAITLLLVLAVMFSCLPLGMVSYAEDTYTRPEFPGMQWLDPSSLTNFGLNNAWAWPASMVFDGLLGEANNGDRNFYENDIRNGSGAVGLDLGENNMQFVRKIRYLPRYGFAVRLNGAVFEGSNTAKDAADYAALTEPLSGHVNSTDKKISGPNGWFEIDVDGYNSYRYLRLARTNEETATPLNVTEIEFYVATGADYIASRAAYEISKEVKTPGNSSQAVVNIPALSDEEAKNYTASFEVMEGEAVIIDETAGTITYTPSAAEDLTAKIKVTVTNKSDPSDAKTFEVPVTIKRQAKNMTKVNANMYQDTFARSEQGNGRARWIVDGNLGPIQNEDGVFDADNKNFYESKTEADEYVGIELKSGNENKFVRKIRYLPRYEFAARLNGAVFEGSNTAKDAADYAALTEPLSGHVNSTDKNISGPNGWFEIDLFDNVDAYKYIRLMRPLSVIQADKNSPLNVTEIELYMASGADHTASLVASRIGKVVPRPADGSGVTKKGFAELTAGTNGYTISYTADGNGITIDEDDTITFTHAEAEDLAATIHVTATSADGADTCTIALPVTIKQNIDEAEKLNKDKALIDAAFKAAAGAEQHMISGYLDLPTDTEYGSTVTWAVSGDNAGEVTLDDNNRLTSKAMDNIPVTVTLTATLALDDNSETLEYTVIVNSGLQVQYNFAGLEDDAKTVANTGFNSIIGDATLESGATALKGAGAVYLNNTGTGKNTAHVKMPPNIVADITGDYTISVMMYKEGDNGWPFYISNSGQGSSNPWFGILNNGKYIFNTQGSNNGNIEINPNGNFKDQWTNIVMSYSGETMTMYVNGENKDSKVIPFKLSEKFAGQPNDAWNLLGACGWGGDQGYTGLITDFRIYSRAFSADEAQAVSGEKPSLVYADWKAVAECRNALKIEKTEDVVQNITLPTPPAGNGSSVSWKSSDARVISDSGVIKENAEGGETAALTATITKGAASTTKIFNIVLGKGGSAEELAEADLKWLNGNAEDGKKYDFKANTVDGQDYIIMTLPTVAPNESVIEWTYDDKAVGVDGSALTQNTDGTVKLFVWKSGFEALSGVLKATITNTINTAGGSPATKTYERTVTSPKLDNIIIPVSAEAISGTAQFHDTYGMLTTKSGKIYFKFDVSGVQDKISVEGKQVVKAELQVRNSLSREPAPVIIREVASGEWNHGDQFGTENEPDSVEFAYVGNSILRYETGRYDITYAFLNGFNTDTTAYALSITNNANNDKDWPDNNTGITSINSKNEPQNWVRLVLTLADSGEGNVPEEYTKINSEAYTTEMIALASKTLATDAPTALPEPPSMMVPNPEYGIVTADENNTEGESPEIPAEIEVKGSWYALNATIDKDNNMIITNKDEDVILGLQFNGYVKCFTLSHKNFVDYQYKKEDVENGVKLKKADNAGEGFLYTAIYEGNRLISVECTDLSKAAWTENTYTYTAPSITTGQTVKYYLWNEKLVPYL